MMLLLASGVCGAGSAMKGGHVPPITVDWKWATYGTGIGDGLLEALDIDADGERELVFSGGGDGFGAVSSVFVLASDLETLECLNDRISHIFDVHISQMDADAPLEILLVHLEGIAVIDGATCRIQARQDLPVGVQDAAVGDLNNDTVPDVVYEIEDELFLAPWNDFSAPSAITDHFSTGSHALSDFVVEPRERPGGDDLVIAWYDIGLERRVLSVLHGETLDLISESNTPCSDMVFAKLASDEPPDLLCGGLELTALDLATGEETSLWPDKVRFIYPTDIDGDAADEILVVAGSFESLILLDSDGTELHRIPNGPSGGAGAIITDIEEDGTLDLFWGAGAGSSGADFLAMGSLSSSKPQLISTDFDQPFRLAEIDSRVGGEGQIVASFAETNSSYRPGGALRLDTSTGQLIDHVLADESGAPGAIYAVGAGNIDSDPALEVCIAGNISYDNFLACLDFASSETEWWVWVEDECRELKLADLNGDEALDLMAVCNTGEVFLLDAESGLLHWEHLPQAGYLGCGGLLKVEGELWVECQENLFDGLGWVARKLATVNGALLGSESIDFQRWVTDGETIYVAEDGVGVGVLDEAELTMSSLLFPTAATMSILRLSSDGKVLLTARQLGEVNPEDLRFEAYLISTTGAFEAKTLEPMALFDAVMPDEQTLYVATYFGVKRFVMNLELLFRDDFE